MFQYGDYKRASGRQQLEPHDLDNTIKATDACPVRFLRNASSHLKIHMY